MIIKNNIMTTSISWLANSYRKISAEKKGIIKNFYEPENLNELESLGRRFYLERKPFELIGYTSNTYFTADYAVDHMISTRKVNNWNIENDKIICDCGVSVSKLSKQMVSEGIKGFEGLIDLPGTIGSAVYGNAACYGGSINRLLLYFTMLLPDGKISQFTQKDLKLTKRSSALKKGELKGIILSIVLKKEYGDKEKIREIMENNQKHRRLTLPGPMNNLGSIFSDSGKPTLLNYMILSLIKIYELIFLRKFRDEKVIRSKKMSLFLKILGAGELFPYVYSWNCYIWKDAISHELFWKYVKLHKLLYSKNVFEIEIKGNFKE